MLNNVLKMTRLILVAVFIGFATVGCSTTGNSLDGSASPCQK
jgi:hypothetical protein